MPINLVNPFCFIAVVASTGVPSLQAQSEYKADGDPTAREEEIRYHTNRARFDRAGENAARGTAYTDVPASSGPLAPHEGLTRAARHHSEDMARHNRFQHETVPGSAYYNATTQPEAWDRMEAEGYYWNVAGENISAGYDSAEAAYVGWWKSAGHRQNMCDPAHREIGNGYFYWAAADDDHYYTMDVGTSEAGTFFTDTLFIDRNGDGSYDEGEGVGGVRITLLTQGAGHTSFDVSSAAGSFAIPIGSISQGSKVEVWLGNQNAAPVRLSIPRDYTVIEQVTLAAGESRVLGMMVHPGSALNVGFRQLTPSFAPIVPPVLLLTRNQDGCRLSWPTQIGLQYLPQRSFDLVEWADLGGAYQDGSGEVLTHDDTTVNNAPQRFYRLLIRGR